MREGGRGCGGHRDLDVCATACASRPTLGLHDTFAFLHDHRIAHLPSLFRHMAIRVYTSLRPRTLVV